jgi:hypothetical protein
MRRFEPLILVVLGLTLASSGCMNRSGPGSGSSGGGATGGGGGGGGGSVTMSFGGPLDAAPSAGDSIALSWSIATNSIGDPISTMRYSVYRGTQRDMADEALVLGTTAQTSMIDSGLLDDVTYYYRVLANDAAGNQSDNDDLVSAHLPTIPPPPIEYVVEVGNLWSSVTARDGKSVCTDCHHDGMAYGFLSLESWERLMIGVGTPTKPNSFIIEGKSKATGAAFVEAYFDPNNPVPEHNAWRLKREFFLPEVQLWIDEGARPAPDLSRPVFDFMDLQNQARYSASENGDGTVWVNFPHASDPDSEPYRGTVNDHLEYHVYGGVNSILIDWRNPVAVVNRYNFKKTETSYGVRFPWAFETGVFVVRAYDYTRNASLNEREVSLAD